MVVEETDVIYEEIQTRKFNDLREYVPKNCCIENEEENEEDEDTSRHSIYEDMNGFGEELFDTYSIQNIHCRQSSDSLLMDLHKPARDTKIFFHISIHILFSLTKSVSLYYILFVKKNS